MEIQAIKKVVAGVEFELSILGSTKLKSGSFIVTIFSVLYRFAKSINGE